MTLYGQNILTPQQLYLLSEQENQGNFSWDSSSATPKCLDGMGRGDEMIF